MHGAIQCRTITAQDEILVPLEVNRVTAPLLGSPLVDRNEAEMEQLEESLARGTGSVRLAI
jgi:hypothetical protein